MQEVLEAEMDEALGASKSERTPELAAGGHLVVMMTESRAGSNVRAKSELGWSPRHASWREGFAEIVRPDAGIAA